MSSALPENLKLEGCSQGRTIQHHSVILQAEGSGQIIVIDVKREITGNGDAELEHQGEDAQTPTENGG